MEILLAIVGVWLCIGVLPGLLLGLVIADARRRPVRQAEPAPPLDTVARYVASWAADGRLSPEIAQQIQQLVDAERAAPPLFAAPVSAELKTVVVPPEVPLSPPAPMSAHYALADAALEPPVPGEPETALSDAARTPVAAPPRRPLLGALLALGTRRTLLYLGTFLLVLSGLTLVIFNWTSFAPPIQTALLAGVTATIWGGGTWMRRRLDLERAGGNLQAVAGLLVPVAAFAFTRPGMLDLAPRTGWLFVALACLPIYVVAAWRTRNSFYSVAAALAGVNALLAALGAVPFAWLPTWLLGLLTIYLAVTPRLRALARADLAAGLYWTAHSGAPLALLVAGAIWFAPQASLPALAGAWAAVALFYCVAVAVEDRRIWGWLAAGATLIAVYSNLVAWVDLQRFPLEAPVMAALAVSGVPIALALRQRRPNIWVAPLTMALIPATIAFSGAIGSPAEARLALPILMFGGFLLLRAARRGRLDGLAVAPSDLDLLGFLVLVLAAPFWLGALLEPLTLSSGLFWTIMLTLALPAFAAAYWWPGRLRPAYDLVLQGVGVLIIGASGAMVLSEPAFRPAASVLLALTLTGQALLRRHRAWAASALAGLVLVGVVFLERSAWAADQTAWQFLGLVYTATYALGATLLRRRLRAEWLAPALIGAALIGGATALFALSTFLGGITAGACLTLVLLGALLAALSRLWYEARLGFPAVVLLTVGTLAAAGQGFFIGWVPGGALAYIVLTTALICGATGLFLRRRAPAFALPYELMTLVLLSIAPLVAAGSPQHLTIVWIALAAFYALITERYRLAWFALAGWISLDLALLQGLAWQASGIVWPQLGIALAGVAWLQGGTALLLRPAARVGSFRHGLMRAGFTALALSGAAAVLLAGSEAWALAVVAFVLLALLVLVATLVPSLLAAWLTLPLLALGMVGLFIFAVTPLATQLLITTCVALGLALFGWFLARSAAGSARVWDAPLRFPPLVIGLLTAPALGLLKLWANDPAGLSLALALWALLWCVGGLRERQPWATLPAATAGNLALLSFLLPASGSLPLALLTGVAYTLAAFEGGLAAMLRRMLHGRLARLGAPLYVAAGVMGGLALLLGLSEPDRLAAVALGLALLVGVLATLERSEAGVWGALALSGLGFVVFGDVRGWAQEWTLAWLPLALLPSVLLGWLLERLGFACWRRPTTIGAAVGGGFAALTLYGSLLVVERLDFTQAALVSVNLGLLWATVGLRLRTITLGYAAGAAFVAAALARLAALGVAEPQWYVVPTGVYLLALSACVRRFQGLPRLAQVLEVVAALLMMGASAFQALRIAGGPGYELVLFGEAFAFIAYGALLRLRMPFVLGIGFAIGAAIWLAVDVSRGVNQWVLLGIFGILMIALYVVLERHQERLVRLGRTWMLELRSWA